MDIHRRTPLTPSRNAFTTVVIVALVALRLLVGWHFFREGSAKVHDQNFSAAGFLGGAKGPFAWYYYGFLKDPEGTERLNYDPSSPNSNQIEREQTLYVWTVHRERVAGYYRFEDTQKKEADRVFRRFEAQLHYFFDANYEDINEYFRGLERVKENAADPARIEVAGLRYQAEQIASNVRKKRGPWLKELDTLWHEYDRELNALANEDQRKRRRKNLELKLPGDVGSYYASVIRSGDSDKHEIAVQGRMKFMDVDTVNWFIPKFDLLIGILLILGLFTRPTAIVAALFLLTVVGSQWPWTWDAMPTYYQGIELVGLVVLAVTGAGRFAGLDFFITNWKQCRAVIDEKMKQRSQAKAAEEKPKVSGEPKSSSDDTEKPSEETEKTSEAIKQEKKDEFDA